jgi:hypothetical protein
LRCCCLALASLGLGGAARRAKPAKIDTFFRGRAQKIFSIKETIFTGFASLLTQGRAASHPFRSGGVGILPAPLLPTPPSRGRKDFLAAVYFLL